MSQTVVILGAGFAGLPLAHRLLKTSLPKTGLKVVLVSPNSHFLWNVAAPRGIIPGEISEDELFIPIAPTFEKYTADEFEFVLGAAESIEPKRNTVHVRLSSCDSSNIIGDGQPGTDGAATSVVYDHLIIATGSRLISSLPLKSLGTHEVTLARLRDLQTQIEAAKSIVIAGGGPTGVEVAGELAAKYGDSKRITLVENSECVLYDAMPAVRTTAEKDLVKLGVKLVYNNRATLGSHINDVDPEDAGRVVIQLSKGGSLIADLFLPLYGVVVNTSFVPSEFLDWEGNLKLQPDMRVIGANNVWGIGDVGNLDPKQLIVLDAQILHLQTALEAVITGSAEPRPYQPGQKPMRLFSMGRRHGTGHYGKWRMPGLAVSLIKGRKLFVDYAPGYASGRALMGASV
jgi:NADH dehydrogenase FAD-containing subunit